MNAQRRADEMRRKMHRIIWIIVLATFALIIAVGLISGIPRGIKNANAKANAEAVKALFDDKTLTASTAEPVVKRPYALYTQEYRHELITDTWNWEYNGRVYDIDLIRDEGLTDQVKDARTCVYIWADMMDAEKTNEYYWEGAPGNGAWFAPVYMTIIDRENGVRYADIQLGSVPLEYQSKTHGGRYHKSLFNPGNDWSTFDLDGWLATHWE